MDAFLIALFLGFIVESGGKMPRLFCALHTRYGGGGGLAAGAGLAIAANMVIAAWAGAMIGAMLTPEARTLFFALALAVAGIGLAFAGRPPDGLEHWRMGPFLTGLTGLFILGFGESAAFLVAGVAASRADPWMAGAGGTLGCIAAVFGPAIAGMAVPDRFRGTVRWSLAALLLLLGFVLAMLALRLI